MYGKMPSPGRYCRNGLINETKNKINDVLRVRDLFNKKLLILFVLYQVPGMSVWSAGQDRSITESRQMTEVQV